MFKKASKNVCTSNVVVSPEPSSSAPSTTAPTKTPENTKEVPENPTPADEKDTQMEYFSDYLRSLSIRAVTKNHL
jgi:hypothetical protein